jgi:hypothetical protein
MNYPLDKCNGLQIRHETMTGTGQWKDKTTTSSDGLHELETVRAQVLGPDPMDQRPR